MEKQRDRCRLMMSVAKLCVQLVVPMISTETVYTIELKTKKQRQSQMSDLFVSHTLHVSCILSDVVDETFIINKMNARIFYRVTSYFIWDSEEIRNNIL